MTYVARVPPPAFLFHKFGAAAITPSDTADERNLVDDENKMRVRYIQTTAAGSITFRHSDGTLSMAIPIAANQSYAMGTAVVHIMSTGTTPGLVIIPLWA